MCSLDRLEFLPGGKLGESFAPGENDCLVDYLAVPNAVKPSPPAGKSRVINKNSSLFKLPPEVLMLILRNLDPESCCSFALTTKQFWNVS